MQQILSEEKTSHEEGSRDFQLSGENRGGSLPALVTEALV